MCINEHKISTSVVILQLRKEQEHRGDPTQFRQSPIQTPPSSSQPRLSRVDGRKELSSVKSECIF
jgi:hypothetical protein